MLQGNELPSASGVADPINDGRCMLADVRRASPPGWAGLKGWLVTERGDSLGAGPRRLARNFLFYTFFS